MNSKVTGLGVVFGLTLLVAFILASDCLAKAKVIPTKLKESGSATLVPAFFTYDGSAVAVHLTGTGKDNFGTFTVQGVAQYSPTSSGTCLAPDSSAGVQYDLVAANWVNTYTSNAGQIFLSATPSATNSECVSDTSIKFGGTTTYTRQRRFRPVQNSVWYYQRETFIGEALGIGSPPARPQARVQTLALINLTPLVR